MEQYHNIAGMRTAADTSGAWIDRAVIPHRLKHGRVVVGRAIKFDDQTKTVHLHSGNVIPYGLFMRALYICMHVSLDMEFLSWYSNQCIFFCFNISLPTLCLPQTVSVLAIHTFLEITP